MDRRSACLATFVFALAAASATAGTPYDQILIYQSNGLLVKAPLPAGPAGPASSTGFSITSLLALPSGAILATTIPVPSLGGGLLPSTLNELLPDGSLRPIRVLDPPADPGPSLPMVSTFDKAIDLALDSRGRVYALIHSSNGTPTMRLAELDPVTGETLGSVAVDSDIAAIATAPAGLWAVAAGDQLRKLDPDSGYTSSTLLNIGDGRVEDIESDSAGRVWYLSQPVCSPICPSMGSIDIPTGVVTPAPSLFYAQTPAASTFTIARRCFESSTARCLQGGRFRAEVEYEAYDGAAGPAQVAPARSRDTGVFSFFDPANWELMVKVLDGCGLNSHFWIYASASTDVGYTMTITDTQTGAQEVYRNPLGQVALTVNDGTAFDCSP